MRTWSRTTSTTLCGGCGKPLAKSEPILLIQLPNVKHDRVRGECCAGSAPPDLPLEPVLKAGAPFPKTFRPVTEALPQRTRGGLKQLAETWSPYKESE